MARAWTARCLECPDAPFDYLAQFCNLAKLAVSTGSDLFSWNINPLHRERSGQQGSPTSACSDRARRLARQLALKS